MRVDSYDYYCEAVAWREQQKMPTVGLSIDRRTFKHASIALTSSSTTSFICACCKCQFTCLDGYNADTGRIHAQKYFNAISATSFKHNWCAAEYMENGKSLRFIGGCLDFQTYASMFLVFRTGYTLLPRRYPVQGSSRKA